MTLLFAAGAQAADTVARDTRLVEAVKAGDTNTALAAAAEAHRPQHAGGRRHHAAALGRAQQRSRADGPPDSRRREADVANRYGVTPIFLACENGSAEAVTRLLKAGVSANTTGELGETALMTCARTGKVAAAKALIERGRIDRCGGELARADAR